MMLPNAERAIIDPAKLTDYCLSATHPVGRHKAAVFRSALGLTAPDAASGGNDPSGSARPSSDLGPG
jgi:hypothetical protein